MILWVLPPFLAICLSLVATVGQGVVDRSGAAGLGPDLAALMVAYSQATGVLFGAGYMPIFVGASPG